VLNGINLTEEQKAELASLASVEAPGEVDGIWTMGWTRGPVETNRRPSRRDVLLYDTRGEWPIAYLDETENFAFQEDGLSTAHPDSTGA